MWQKEGCMEAKPAIPCLYLLSCDSRFSRKSSASALQALRIGRQTNDGTSLITFSVLSLPHLRLPLGNRRLIERLFAQVFACRGCIGTRGLGALHGGAAPAPG